MHRNLRRIAAIAVLALLAGCATTPVQPWERGRLARWDMRWDADAKEAAMANHAHFSKEGTTGEIGAAGGGCGCN
ncbi:MAG TPA: DUF4266 domain-containing protein [Rudaea sp.]